MIIGVWGLDNSVNIAGGYAADLSGGTVFIESLSQSYFGNNDP
jgi:hypothetical protein